MLVLPVTLALALMIALAPACTMASCSPLMGLADTSDHHGSDCQDYMKVHDPDGVPNPQPPAAALVAVMVPPITTASALHVCAAVDAVYNPGFDPLGVRIRI